MFGGLVRLCIVKQNLLIVTDFEGKLKKNSQKSTFNDFYEILHAYCLKLFLNPKNKPF